MLDLFDATRSVEIFGSAIRDGMSCGYGSGYRISTHLVLTAKHIFNDDELEHKKIFKIRLYQSKDTNKDEKIDSQVIFFSNTVDLALLKIIDTQCIDEIAPIYFWKIDHESSDPLSFKAVGYPNYAVDQETDGNYANQIVVDGYLNPTEVNHENLQRLISHRDIPKQKSTSPWGGMSGAAVFAELGLIGVVVKQPSLEQPAELYMQELDAVYKDVMWNEVVEQHNLLNFDESQFFLENPYKGLNFFEEQDSGRFYGREDDIVKIRSYIKTNKFLAVVGNSGTGKSSTIYAGVIPELNKDGNWLIIRTRPKEKPFQNLAKDIKKGLEENSSNNIIDYINLSKQLESEGLNLSSITSVITQKPNIERLLIIIDQFEELFTSNKGMENEQQDQTIKAYIDMLLLAQASDLNIHIIIVIRTDFLSFCQHRSDFSELIDSNQYTLHVLDNVEKLRRGIELPDDIINRPRVRFESGLIDKILSDTNAELPLLQFTLVKLWEATQGKKITHVDYEAINKGEGALAEHAKDVYRKYQTKGLGREFKQILIRLVNIDSNIPDVRRIVKKSQFTEHWDLITELATDRLIKIVSNNHKDDENETVEIIHEALIRNWKDLENWVNKERDFLRQEQVIDNQLQDWQKNDCKNDDLLSGSALSDAKKYLDFPNLTTKHKSYIEKSQHYARSLKRRRKNIRMLLSSISAIAIIAAGIANFSFLESNKQRQQALENERQALENERLAVKNEQLAVKNEQLTRSSQISSQAILASSSPSEANGYSNTALLLAVESVFAAQKLNENNLIINSNLAKILQNTPILEYQKSFSEDDSQVKHITFHPDDKTFFSSGKELIQWDINTGSKKNTFNQINTTPKIISALSPNGNMFAATQYSATGIEVVLWDINTQEKKFTIEDSRIKHISFHPSSNILATGGDELILWNLNTFKKEYVFDLIDINYFIFSPDGNSLIASGNNKLVLFDVKTGKKKQTIELNWVIGRARFSSDSNILATAIDESGISLWDVSTGEKQVLDSGTSSLFEFSPDSKEIAIANRNNIISLWDTQTGEQKRVLGSHIHSVTDLVYSPSGSTLVSSARTLVNREFILWNLSNLQPKSVIETHRVYEFTFNREGNKLITSHEGAFTVWGLETQLDKNLISNRIDSFESIAFNVESSKLAFGSTDNTIIVWDINKNIQILELDGHSASIQSISFTQDNDNTRLSSQDSDGTSIVWHLDKIQEYSKVALDDNIATVRKNNNVPKPPNKIFIGRVNQNISPETFHEGASWAIYSPNRKVLASVGSDSTIKIRYYDDSGRQSKILEPGSETVATKIFFSSDSKIIASVDYYNSIKLWDVTTGMLIQTLGKYGGGSGGSLKTIAFSPDNQILAFTGVDKKIILWDLQTNEKFLELGDNTSFIDNISFSSDGKHLISQSGNNAMLWNVNIADLLSSACKNAGRNLSSGEWRKFMGNSIPREKTCTEEKVGKEFNYR